MMLNMLLQPVNLVWLIFLWTTEKSFDAVHYVRLSLTHYPEYLHDSYNEACHNWYTFVTSDIPWYGGAIWNGLL